MKTQTLINQRLLARHRGYSLIELLVVITIIAILASLAYSGIRAALVQAYKVETKTQLLALETAVQSYFTEYSRLPGGGTTDELLRLNQGTDVLQSLLGEASAVGQSPRRTGTSFLQVKTAKAGRSGLLEHGDGYLSLLDHWGNPVYLILDWDLDERIPNPDVNNEERGISTNAPKRLRTRAAAFSAGPDGRSGTKDDIVTWR